VRSAAQIDRTVSEWHDHQAAERRRILAELLIMLERARLTGADWYTWALSRRELEPPIEPAPDSVAFVPPIAARATESLSPAPAHLF
jgi:hypothetical protein